MLEKHLWNTFLLCVVVEIRQLINEISSFPETLYKKGDLKNFSESTGKHKSSHPEAFYQKKRCSLKICKIQKKTHLCSTLFVNKVASWKLGTVRSNHWRCYLKKVFLKRRPGISEPAVHRSSTNWVYVDSWQNSLEKICVGVSF